MPRKPINMGYGGTNGTMLRNQLRSVRRAADTLYDATVDGDQVPEWVLTKVAVTLDNLQTAEDYVLSKLEGYKPNPKIDVEGIKQNAFQLKRLVKNGYVDQKLRIKEKYRNYSSLPAIRQSYRLSGQKLTNEKHPPLRKGTHIAVYFNLNAMYAGSYGQLSHTRGEFESLKKELIRDKGLSPRRAKEFVNMFFSGSIYSVKRGNKVIRHLRSGRLSNVVFTTDGKKIAAIRRTGSKAPCCYMNGIFEGKISKKERVQLSYPSTIRKMKKEGWVQVAFNPKKTDTFMYIKGAPSNWPPIYSAQEVIFMSDNSSPIGRPPALILARGINLKKSRDKWRRGKSKISGVQRIRMNPIKKYEGELGNNRHITAVYTGFMSPEKAKYLKGKNNEHDKWDFHRGSCHGRGRYSYKEWEKFKKDVEKNGIKERVFVVAEWVNGKVKARVYEGNHRIRMGCQLDIPIPVEIRFFGQAEDFADEANSPLDFYDEKIWAKADQDLSRLLQYGFVHE